MTTRRFTLLVLLVMVGCMRSGNSPVANRSVTKSTFLPDSALQQFQVECDSVLKGRVGCLGVVDLRSGQLIALVNKGILASEVSRPGSVFKLVTAFAALSSGKVDPGFSYYCRGRATIEGRQCRCWLPQGHGRVNFAEGIARSCNLYFYHLAQKLDAEELRRWAERFGFGKVTPFRLEDKASGVLRQTLAEQDKLDFAVGQSESIQVTPIQLLHFISIIATKGKFRGAGDSRSEHSLSISLEDGFKINSLHLLYEGLRRSVQSGTSNEASLPNVAVAGKTGTVSQGIGVKTSAWFIGYAPFESPEIAVVVFVKGGLGASDAAPIAGRVFRAYFALRQ